MATEYSNECREVLRLLSFSKNVLISGPPGTGKSRLLTEVAHSFLEGNQQNPQPADPVHDESAAVPIPPTPMESAPTSIGVYPSPEKINRSVFRTVFHQSSKYRDFLTGIIPNITNELGSNNFKIITGTLYKASEHAKTSDGASLLIIDEINRGPAVQIFGGSIVAIEADKRLAPDGNPGFQTQYFEILHPDTGEIIEYALPHDLYILAALNQADASVEPLDVAFLRRWEPFRLDPSVTTLRNFYQLGEPIEIPEIPTLPQHVFEASAMAWQIINEKISLGRGTEFQIGHGVLFGDVKIEELDITQALNFVSLGWGKIRSHIDEVFFGDMRGVAAVLNALEGPTYNPFKLEETEFAGELRYKLNGPSTLNKDNIYPFLRALAVL